MKRVYGWFALALMAVTVGFIPAAAAEPKPAKEPAKEPVKLGLLNGMFRDVPPAVVHAAQIPFRDLFKKHTGFDSAVSIVSDHNALAAKLDAKELHIGVFHGFEWAWVRDRYPNLEPLVVTIPLAKPQACLVVHVDSKAAAPVELKGSAISLPFTSKAHVYLYQERLQHSLPTDSFRTVKEAKLGPQDVLDGIKDGDLPAALVDFAALTAYRNSKPGAAKQLKVLCQSEPLPPTIIVYRKNVIADADITRIRRGLLGADKDPQGRAFLLMWSLRGFENVPEEYDALLRKSLAAFPPPPEEMTAVPK